MAKYRDAMTCPLINSSVAAKYRKGHGSGHKGVCRVRMDKKSLRARAR